MLVTDMFGGWGLKGILTNLPTDSCAWWRQQQQQQQQQRTATTTTQQVRLSEWVSKWVGRRRFIPHSLTHSLTHSSQLCIASIWSNGCGVSSVAVLAGTVLLVPMEARDELLEGVSLSRVVWVSGSGSLLTHTHARTHARFHSPLTFSLTYSLTLVYTDNTRLHYNSQWFDSSWLLFSESYRFSHFWDQHKCPSNQAWYNWVILHDTRYDYQC